MPRIRLRQCMNAVVFGVKKLAQPTEKLLYLKDDAEDKVKAMDEQLCRSLRWAPIIRNDEISFEPEKADDDEEEEETANAEVPDSPKVDEGDNEKKEDDAGGDEEAGGDDKKEG